MISRYNPKDRRRLQRLKLNIAVHYRVNEPLHIKVMVGDKEIEARMLDINIGGMGLLTDFNIPAYSLLLLKFSFFRTNKLGLVKPYGPIEATGVVRYNILLEHDQYRLGIRFDKINKEDEEELHKFVKMSLNP
ncbi:MAG: PilZ domain-containing protein [Candidatus Omnitrophica bacterium]|nr:PilZ domain-containing protein [Candidatus Omnitrophota bacterium]MBU1872056.1 PilZ domain-containing protein [Candidatus Omnitrophota bacterium]